MSRYLIPIARQEVDVHERLVMSNRDRELFSTLLLGSRDDAIAFLKIDEIAIAS
ncbi:hypothetical protein [Coleofasciculus sp.]|uniref:hypothetical protein n=1 Tax=Coleofasciculus sp. TaxID=3100458 RepID=UPI003A2C66CC